MNASNTSFTPFSGDQATETRLAALEAENAQLRTSMLEAEETLRALRNDEVDAIVVGEKIYTLVGADASANRMRGEALSQMEDAIVATDLAGRVLYLNPAAERQYGKSAGEILGLPGERLYAQEWLDVEDKAACEAALAAGGAWRGKVVHLTDEGRRLQLECTFSCMRDERDQLSGYLAVLRDTSARANAEAALAESRAQLQFSMESARIGVWTIDLDSGLWTGSALHAACFGYETMPAPWGIKSFLAHVHPEDRAQIDATLRMAAEHSADCHFECRVVWPDGSIHWIEVHGNSYLPDHRPASMVGIVSDITQRKRANEALREADRQKDEFLATLAHELRNPLAPIRTAAYILSSKNLTIEAHAKSADIITRQVGHMARLLDDLLDVARITRRRMTLKKDYVDLRAAVETGVEAIRASIDAKNHTLKVELPAAPIWLEADPVRVAQVVSNLLNNASKYSNPGAQITVAARPVSSGFCELTVQDTGIGMTPTALRSVFNMFAQEEAVLDRAEGGLGIGLALVRGLVELHGGSVRASSPGLGKGSTFVVRLPTSSRGAGGVGEASTVVRAEGSAIHDLLIADDNVDAVDTVAVWLQMFGHRVVVARDGLSAFALARERHPQAMLLDIGMPGLNGYELAKKIRQEAWGREVLLIAATGWGQEEDKAKAVAAGFDAHLTKPFNPDALLEILKESLDKRR